MFRKSFCKLSFPTKNANCDKCFQLVFPEQFFANCFPDIFFADCPAGLLICKLWHLLATAVKRHCTDRYEIWASTDHEIYYMKIELDLQKFSNGPFSETEKCFGVGPTPGGSQCTGVSPTLSWQWPRTTLSPSFGPFFEGIHCFGVKRV